MVSASAKLTEAVLVKINKKMCLYFTKAVVYFFLQILDDLPVEFDRFCLEISLNPRFFNNISSLFSSYLYFILNPFYASDFFTLTDLLNISFSQSLCISQFLLCYKPPQSSMI